MGEKEVQTKLPAESEENTKKLKKFTPDQPGWPPVEDTYPDLHEAIVALASAGAGADRCRRTEVLNACHILDDLRATLLKGTCRRVHVIPTSTLSQVDTTKK